MSTPISETGKPVSGGFTLLEVLGIIVLLGLASILAIPKFANSSERIKLQYFGKLLQTDIQLVREDAVSEGDDQAIIFENNGYCFNIGSRMIKRLFYDYGFTFDRRDETVGRAETVDTAGAAVVTEAAGEESASESAPVARVEFTPAGVCQETNLNWTSDHFQGSLKVQPDGRVEWTYGKK